MTAYFSLARRRGKLALQHNKSLSKDHGELSAKTILSYALFLVLGPGRRQLRREIKQKQKKKKKKSPTSKKEDASPQRTNEKRSAEPSFQTARQRAISRWGQTLAFSPCDRRKQQEYNVRGKPPSPISARALCQLIGTSTTSMFRLKRTRDSVRYWANRGKRESSWKKGPMMPQRRLVSEEKTASRIKKCPTPILTSQSVLLPTTLKKPFASPSPPYQLSLPLLILPARCRLLN